MRKAAIILSLIIAAAITIIQSAVLGILIALACGVYQMIQDYENSQFAAPRMTVNRALFLDIVKSGVFLLPLLGALLSGEWLAALATVVVYGINLYTWEI
jgi:hypothetical protein